MVQTFLYWYHYTINRFLDVIENPYVSKVKLFSGISAFLWGLWVALPFDTFRNDESYTIMAKIFVEPIWGWLTLIIGLVQILGLIYEEKIPKRFISKISLVGFISWCTIFVCFILGGIFTTAVPIYLVICIFAYLAYMHS